MKRPLVSILIPCYNAGGSISECIQSALDQTYPKKEILVLDDGSTDDSLDVIRSMGDKIKWFSQRNQGGSSARNMLLQQSKGEWLQYLDADDYLLRQKVERQVDILSRNAEIDMIYSPIIAEYNRQGRIVREEHKIPEGHDVWDLLTSWRFPQTGNALWRKQAITDVGGWKEGLECCQEHELYSRMLMGKKKFAFSPHAGAVYRIHEAGSVASRDPLGTIKNRIMIIDSIEVYLCENEEMTGSRQYSINLSRFESARTAWCFDREYALGIMEKVRKCDRSFVPSGPAALPLYRAVYRSFGFKAAELLAETRSRITRQQ